MSKRVFGAIAAALYGGTVMAASSPAEPPASQPASYVFATELSSAVCDVSVRALLVYRLPFSACAP